MTWQPNGSLDTDSPRAVLTASCGALLAMPTTVKIFRKPARTKVYSIGGSLRAREIFTEGGQKG